MARPWRALAGPLRHVRLFPSYMATEPGTRMLADAAWRVVTDTGNLLEPMLGMLGQGDQLCWRRPQVEGSARRLDQLLRIERYERRAFSRRRRALRAM